MRHHAGQVSFPGGAAETDDAGAAQTAIREAEEEIGLSPSQIEVIGYLPEHPVISGFSVTPVVALVTGPVHYRVDYNEVAEVFELPWVVAAKPSNGQLQSRIIGGVAREVFAFEYQGYDVWGATAAMIVDLTQRYSALHPVGARQC